MPRIRKLCRETPQIVYSHNNGATLRELADFYETCPGTIRNILLREGVKLRKRGRKPYKELDNAEHSEPTV